MVAGGCALVALVAAVADWRRRRRRDPDRVGYVDWPTVEVLALIGLAVSVALILA